MTNRPIPLAATLGSLAMLILTLAAAPACGAAARPATTAAHTTITAAQYAKRFDQIHRRDVEQQAALGPGLLNADIVTKPHLPRAAAYLDKIVAITATEVRSLAALARTEKGMPQRHAFLAALRKVLTDERVAARAAHNGNLTGFRAAFDRFILHGYPTGPDYRRLIHAFKAEAKIFPIKLSGKTSAIYP